MRELFSPSLSKPCGPFLERFLVSSKRITSILSSVVSALLLLSLTACASSEKNNSDSEKAQAPEVSSSPILGYRYWGYFQSNTDGSAWETAMEGPATTNPKDGSVEGWNYTISAEGVVDPSAPATLPNFNTLCGTTEVSTGEKRVGYIIEFGDSAIYPEGDVAPESSSGCAALPINASGLDLLNKVAKVRAGDGGFICGLNEFPSKDCGADPIPVPQSLRKD